MVKGKPLINILILIIFISVFFGMITFAQEGQTEKIEHGMKIVTNDEVSISAKEVEHCAWKPDSINDGYKNCEAIIEGYNPNNYELTVDVFNFDLDKVNIVKNKKYEYYFSNQFELYNELILNESCISENPEDCHYEVERKRFYNWIYLGDKVKTTYDDIDFAYKVKFEFPQYDSTSYNFSISYKKADSSEIPILLDPDISACGNLNIEGATYTQTADIEYTSYLGCINIKNSSIIFDMNGHFINLSNPAESSIGVTTYVFGTPVKNNVTIKNGIIYGGNGGIQAVDNQNSSILNMNFYDQYRSDATSAWAIKIGNAKNITLNNIFISNPERSGIMFNDNDCTLTGYNITIDAAQYAIDQAYIRNNNIINIYNSSFTSSTTTDIFFSAGSSNNLTMINCSYSTENIGTDNKLTRKWYFDGQVNYTHNGTVVNGANVSAYDKNSDLQFSVLSNSDGSIAQQILIEYINTGGTKTYYNNHTINATLTNWDDDSRSLNITDNINQQFNISDTTAPSLSIIHPENSQSFTTGTIDLNYTTSDSGSGLDKCWYLNNTGSNITINCGTNTTISQAADGDYTIYMWVNDTVGNEASDSHIWTVSTDAPAVNLINPPDEEAFNYDTNILFNYTAEDSDGIDTCQLWINSTGIWHLNQSDTHSGDTSVDANEGNFIISFITDDFYEWNIWCNDTSTPNKDTFATLNRTFTIDTIFPNVTINNIDTVAGSRTISFNSTVADTNLDSCWYSIFNSTGGIDGDLENKSFTCNTVEDVTVSAFATYNLTVYTNDFAGNENSTTQSFTTSVLVVPGVGGGTTTVIVGDGETAWSMETETGSLKYDLFILEDQVRVKSLIFRNLGTENRIIKLKCEGDLCQFLTLSDTEITLAVGIDIPTEVIMNILIPKDVLKISDNKTLTANIIATDDLKNEGIITIDVRVSYLGFVTLFFQKVFTGKDIKGVKIPYLLFGLFIAIISYFIITLGIFRKLKVRRAIGIITALINFILIIILM